MNINELAKELDLKQVVDSYYLQLNSVYADSKLIFANLSFGNYSGETPPFAGATILDAYGNYHIQRDTSGVYTYRSDKAMTVSFFTNPAVEQISKLDLHLEVIIYILEPNHRLASKISLQSGVRYGNWQVVGGNFVTRFVGPHDPRSALPHPNSNKVGRAIGTFKFDFDVPVVQAREFYIEQLASAMGYNVILKSIVATPSIVIASLQVFDKDSPDRVFLVSPEVELNYTASSELFDHAGAGSTQINNSVTCELIAGGLYSIYDTAGDWEFKIKAIEIFDTNKTSVQNDRIDGPWVFHFTIPPATTQP